MCDDNFALQYVHADLWRDSSLILQSSELYRGRLLSYLPYAPPRRGAETKEVV